MVASWPIREAISPDLAGRLKYVTLQAYDLDQQKNVSVLMQPA